MYNVSKLLRVCGVRGRPQGILGGGHSCPRHNGSQISPIVKVFSSNNVPFLRCHICGVAKDPIWFLADARRMSMDAAGEELRVLEVFTGSDVQFRRELQRSITARGAFELVHKFHKSWEVTNNATRRIDVRAVPDRSRVWFHSIMTMSDLRDGLPFFKRIVNIGAPKNQMIQARLTFAPSGAPGQLKLISQSGALLQTIILDTQAENSHLYFSAPLAMLHRRWDEDLFIFPDADSGALSWDWLSEFLGVRETAAAVVIDSIAGVPPKVSEISRVTMLPIGEEKAFAGTVFSAGSFCDVKVLRLSPDHERTSATDTIGRFCPPAVRETLPSVIEDFVKTGVEMIRTGRIEALRESRAALLDTPFISHSDKEEADKRLSICGEFRNQEEAEIFLQEMSRFSGFDTPDGNYTAVSSGYLKRPIRPSDPPMVISNFRSQIRARVESGGTACLVLKTFVSGSGGPVLSIVKESALSTPGVILSQVNLDSLRTHGVPAFFTSPREVRNFGVVLQASSRPPIEVIFEPLIGIDHEGTRFGIPGRTVPPEAASSPIDQDVAEAMLFPFGGLASTPVVDELQDFLAARQDEADLGLAAAIDAIAVGTWFIFHSLRAPALHLSINGPEILGLVSRLCGIPRIGLEGVRFARSSRLDLSGIPVATDGVSASAVHGAFRYGLIGCNPGNSEVSIPVGGRSIAPEDCPAGDLFRLADSCIRSASPREAAMDYMGASVSNHQLIGPRIGSRMDALASVQGTVLREMRRILLSEIGETFILSRDRELVWVSPAVIDYMNETSGFGVSKRRVRDLLDSHGFLSGTRREGQDRTTTWGVRNFFLDSHE